jgi:hypothetical protein
MQIHFRASHNVYRIGHPENWSTSPSSLSRPYWVVTTGANLTVDGGTNA